MTLLTLTPALPSRPDPCDSAIKPNLLSWVFQRPPLHRTQSRSPLSVCRRFAFPRSGVRPGRSCRFPAIRSRGFAPPQRLDPSRLRRFVSPCCRPWGSLRFPSSRNEVPRSAIPALRSFPSVESVRHGTGPWRPFALPLPCGETITPGAERHRSSCPPAVPRRDVRNRFLDPLHHGFPWLSHVAATSGPCSFNGSVALAAVSSRQSPVLPWA